MITELEITGQSEKQRKSQLANLAQGVIALQENRGLVNKRAGGENAAIVNGLVGDLDPVRIAKRETPVHRTMVNMAAAGYTNREIAAQTGYSPTTVATAIKQPHAREYLINEAKKTVQDEIKALLEREVIPSLEKLVAVRDNPQARGADVITASNSILDRFLGKPTQPITTDAKPVEQMSEDELNARTNAILTGFGRIAGAPVAPAS